MKDLSQITGFDSSGAPSILDWQEFMYQKIVPTYKHQPLIARKICNPMKVTFDGKKYAELPRFQDIDEPAYGMEPTHKDTKLVGDTVNVPLPQFSLTTLLSKDEMKRTFAQRPRLNRWTNQAVMKIAQWEDIVAFRGDTDTGVVGFIGSDSHDLNNPTGVWDVDANSNGILDNAWADMIKAKDYFINEGFGERPLHIVLSTYAYTLLASTIVLYTTETNLDLWMKALPKGSMIYYSNNIQSDVTVNSNSMCVFLELTSEDEGGYELYSSGIEQDIHRTDNWEYRYGLREKFSVKVRSDLYVAYMDGIDCQT